MDIWVASNLLTTVIHATPEIYVQGFVSVSVFSSFGYIPGSGIADNSMVSFPRNLKLFFHSDFPKWLHHLHSHQQYTRISKSLHPFHHLFSIKNIIVILEDVKWYFMWLYFSLMMLSILACPCWPFIYFLWRNVYFLSLLSIFFFYTGYFLNTKEKRCLHHEMIKCNIPGNEQTDTIPVLTQCSKKDTVSSTCVVYPIQLLNLNLMGNKLRNVLQDSRIGFFKVVDVIIEKKNKTSNYSRLKEF